MTSEADELARFRVAVDTGRLPRDVGLWALGRLQSRAASRTHRARELNRAAAAIGKSRKATARQIAAIVAYFEEYPGALAVEWFPDGSPERIVQLLMRAGPVPGTSRHLLRLIR